MIGAQYTNRNLTRELTNIIGDATLSELPGHVLVTTFDLDNEDRIPKNAPGNPNCSITYPEVTMTQIRWLTK